MSSAGSRESSSSTEGRRARPVALISAGTTDAQHVVECELAEAGEAVRHLAAPVTVVIGELVRARSPVAPIIASSELRRLP